MAESFGDLDPKLDAREADLGPGQAWTGWHQAEKDLFPPEAMKELQLLPSSTVFTAMAAGLRAGACGPVHLADLLVDVRAGGSP